MMVTLSSSLLCSLPRLLRHHRDTRGPSRGPGPALLVAQRRGRLQHGGPRLERGGPSGRWPKDGLRTARWQAARGLLSGSRLRWAGYRRTRDGRSWTCKPTKERALPLRSPRAGPQFELAKSVELTTLTIKHCPCSPDSIRTDHYYWVTLGDQLKSSGALRLEAAGGASGWQGELAT